MRISSLRLRASAAIAIEASSAPIFIARDLTRCRITQVNHGGNVKITRWTDAVSHLPVDGSEGMVAVQVRRETPDAKSQPWAADGYRRFLNMKTKELN